MVLAKGGLDVLSLAVVSEWPGDCSGVTRLCYLSEILSDV